MRPVALIALLAALVPRANAQRTALPGAHHRPSHSSAVLFADPFYSDALYREGSFATSQPPVIILETVPTPAPIATPPTPPAQPLMIELQAGRYVRVSGEETSTAEIKLVDSASTY